jgi:hypothetical protein
VVQIGKPSVANNTTWAASGAPSLVEAIDEGLTSPDDDTSYIAPTANTQMQSFGLQALIDPRVDSGFRLRWRARLSGSASIDVRLKSAGVLIASKLAVVPGGIWADDEIALSNGECAAVGSFTDLDVEFETVSFSGGASLRITAVQFETPDPPPFNTDLRVTQSRVALVVRPRVASIVPLALPPTLAAHLMPNWDYDPEVETRWLVDITRSKTRATEERRCLLERPVRTVKYRALASTAAELQRGQQHQQRRALGRGPIPIPPDATRLRSAASADFLDCETANRRFVVGGRIMLHGWDACEGDARHGKRPAFVAFLTVEAIQDDGLVLTASVPTTYAAGSRVMPCIDAEMRLEASAVMETDERSTVEVIGEEVPGESCLPALASTCAIVTAIAPDGVPIFDFPIDWDRELEPGLDRTGEAVDLGRGTYVAGDGPRGPFTLGVPMRFNTRAEWFRFARFFDTRQGSTRPFWFAAPWREFEVVAAATLSIDVRARGNFEDVEVAAVAIGIRTRAGSVFVRRVDDFSVVDPTTWRFEFTESIAECGDLSTWRHVALARLCRFDTDTLPETWLSGSFVELEMPIRECVNEEPATITDIEDGLEVLEVEALPHDSGDLVLWVESGKNAWEGNSASAPATTRLFKSDHETHWNGDFWDDARVDATVLYPDGEFPIPYLARDLSSDDVGPFFVRFDKKKKWNKGKPVWEHSGTSGAKWKLINEDAHFWDNTDGLTVVVVAAMKHGEEHVFIDRPGVLRWSTLGAKTYTVLGVDNPAEWLTVASHETINPHTYVLRWSPGASLRIIRGGKNIGTKSTGVTSAMPLDPVATSVLAFESTHNGRAGWSNHKAQSFSVAMRIYRRALSAGEVNAIGKHYKKLYGAPWKNVGAF